MRIIDRPNPDLSAASPVAIFVGIDEADQEVTTLEYWVNRLLDERHGRCANARQLFPHCARIPAGNEDKVGRGMCSCFAKVLGPQEIERVVNIEPDTPIGEH